MDLGLKGKVAIITGGSEGIGKAAAKSLAAEGANVIIFARRQERLDNASKEILDATGANITTVSGDVTKPKDIEGAVQKAIDLFGKIDILVNNAGTASSNPFDEVDDAEWAADLDLKLFGAIRFSRQVIPHMKKQGGGRVINIGSIAAQRARHNSVPYTTSKHAVWGLTQSSALEGRDFGIAVSSIHPGNVAVERRSDGRSSTGRDEGPEPLIQPEEIGKTALLMATLPENSNMLEAIILPLKQDYLGRG